MKLEELKKMIREEFDAFQNEAEDDVDVNVDADEMDAEAGDEGTEEVLRNIFDLLKAHFEGGEEEMGDEEAPEDVEGEPMDEEADLEENSTTAPQYQKTGFGPAKQGSAGPNVGYGTPGGKGNTGFSEKTKALQERFQRLANIIK